MHPAPSVIFFTALSGLGFGLLAFLGINIPRVEGMDAFIYFFVAFALSVAGLLSSTFHLGNPQRAWRAFSQWRTSWLSREGVVSVVTLMVMGLYALLLIFFDLRVAWLGFVGSALSILTVICTAMIYNQLKTVPRWHQGLTVPLFLLFTFAGGAILAGQERAAMVATILLVLVQFFHWQIGDRSFAKAGSTIESATGLGFLGKVRLLESPHSSKNYLMKEMVHKVGRKHANRLRFITILLVGLVPLFLILVFPLNSFILAGVLTSHVIGLLAARWLFFAEAEHVVGLYYDER